MVIEPLSIKKDYWKNFEVSEKDIEFLYNFLLEVETPRTPEELVYALVTERIRLEKAALDIQQQAKGSVYYPKDQYQLGDSIQFPALDWQIGKVVNIRRGQNPELAPFDVIEVEFTSGEKRQFASGVETHKLNQPISINASDPLLDIDYVIENFGEDIHAGLDEELQSNPGLVRIAGKWFPRALLVDINIGHLNLAEAVLDMMGGGPLSTQGLMEQIDLPSDDDSNLNEFSLNLALQEDKRFDEVGPSGEIMWYLHRLEPESVQEVPSYLRFPYEQVNDPDVTASLSEFESQILDELEPALNPAPKTAVDHTSLCLIYPHWRAGTLPLAGALSCLAPTALESPRIQFTFVDGNSGEKFEGWVIRQNNYIYGLRDWYLSQGLITGSLVHVERSKNPGEIIIRAEKKRGSRDWIRTVMVGSDGGIVFSMLKHNITAAIDERMAMVISDVDLLDKVWERNIKQRAPWAQTIKQVMFELAKLSPQNHVHAQELYAGINILRRCPPGMILNVLINNSWAKHLGNLYFRLDETSGGDNE
jgi:hypothetical protein